MKHVGALALGIGLIFSSIASASPSDFPRYDAAARCRAAGGAGWFINNCIEVEQKGYDNLRLVWDDLNEDEKTQCSIRIKQNDFMAYHDAALCAAAWDSRRKEMERLNSPHHFHE